MKIPDRPLWFVLFLCLCSWSAAREAEPWTWTVDGITREGLVYRATADTGSPAPLVFVFHGHGGSARQAAQSLAVHAAWPEAVVVYLQGLPTPGRLTDAEGRRRGWQAGPGEQGDRDLRFFDVAFADVCSRYVIDTRRVYACGHSNGGSFTYLLWAERRPVFAAFGPSGAVAGRDYGTLEPAPVLHIAGRTDPLVKYSWQEAMIARLRRTQRCEPGVDLGGGLTRYPSAIGAPVVTYVHTGGHAYPAEATSHLVAFFREHLRR